MKTKADDAYELGRKYLQGDGVTHSYEKGTIYLKQAADLGHAKAQYNLAVCFHEGMGVEKSYETAYKYFHMAADQGHPRSNYMLGCYHAFGLFFPPSYPMATIYFRLAADAGISEAQYDLAVLLLMQKETQKEAIFYFRAAAEQGHRDALYNLGICFFQGLGVEASHDNAVHFLELAVKKGQPKAAEALEKILMGEITLNSPS